MVRLSSWLASTSGNWRGEHGKYWYQTKHAKVNLSWAALIVVGLGTFVLARNDAIKKRQDQMRIRKEIKALVTREQEQELAAATKDE